MLAVGQYVVQSAFLQVEKLHLLVPVPGEAAAGKGVEGAQIGGVGKFRRNLAQGFLKGGCVDAAVGGVDLGGGWLAGRWFHRWFDAPFGRIFIV